MGFAWDGRMRVVGHRGAPRDEVENTLASFRAALALGADAVELDARLSSDGEVVVHHDAELGRVIPGSAAIETTTAADLEKLGVPRLADVLREVPCPIDVEIKPDGDLASELPEAVARVVARADALDRVLVTSFDPALADDYAARAGRPAGWVTFFPVVAEDVAELPRLRHVLLAREAATEDSVSSLREAGRIVSAWTVNDPEDAAMLVARGVTGLVTDRPGALRARLPR